MDIKTDVSVDAVKEATEYLCRICAKTAPTFVKIEENNENNRPIPVILKDFFNITVSSNDGLPNAICMSCMKVLNNFEKKRAEVIRCNTLFQNEYKVGKKFKVFQEKNKDLKVKNTLDNFVIRNASQPLESVVKVECKNSLDHDADSNEMPPPAKRVRRSSTSSESVLKIRCRVCLDLFAPECYVDHVCDTSSVFQCMKCRMGFKNSNDLEKHKMSHRKISTKKAPKELVANCYHCQMEFSPQDLEKHLLMVARQRIYSCSHCVRLFGSKEERDEHTMKSHSRPKQAPKPEVSE